MHFFVLRLSINRGNNGSRVTSSKGGKLLRRVLCRVNPTALDGHTPNVQEMQASRTSEERGNEGISCLGRKNDMVGAWFSVTVKTC